MSADDYRVAAIIALTAWCMWWIIRDKLREDAADEPTTVRPEHDDELWRLVRAELDDLAAAVERDIARVHQLPEVERRWKA